MKENTELEYDITFWRLQVFSDAENKWITPSLDNINPTNEAEWFDFCKAYGWKKETDAVTALKAFESQYPKRSFRIVEVRLTSEYLTTIK